MDPRLSLFLLLASIVNFVGRPLQLSIVRLILYSSDNNLTKFVFRKLVSDFALRLVTSRPDIDWVPRRLHSQDVRFHEYAEDIRTSNGGSRAHP
jgi:hypothetical protein